MEQAKKKYNFVEDGCNYMTKEERIAFRKALLSIGKDDLLAEAAQISALLANASVCVIGAKEKLEAAKNAGEIDFIRDFGAAEG